MAHPLYGDAQLVARVTREHLDAGRSVFQIFQLSADEREHSLRVLALLKLPERARVLSIGCGVGGMERYWHEERPDLQFELVNKSAEQLALCVCPVGPRIVGDADLYVAREPADCVLLAYVLGHCDIACALAAAIANARTATHEHGGAKAGVVVVLDAVDGTRDFDEGMSYGSPRSEQLKHAGFWSLLERQDWQLAPFIKETAPWVEYHASPGMWVRRGSV